MAKKNAPIKAERVEWGNLQSVTPDFQIAERSPTPETPKAKRRSSRESLADWRAIENEREKYAAYLCSREWGVLKEAVHKRSGGTCERCGILPGNAVHHLTYERKYREEIEDLQHTCHACHDFTHGKSEFDPIGECGVESGRKRKAKVEYWAIYLYTCLRIPVEPVPSTWAWFGWGEQIIDEAVEADDRFLAVVLLKDLIYGNSANVIYRLPVGEEDYREIVLSEAYERAMETICENSDIPASTPLWILLECPTIHYELYDESIRQVRKCL